MIAKRQRKTLWIVVPTMILLVSFVGLPTLVAHARCAYLVFNTEAPFLEKVGTALARVLLLQTVAACSDTGWEPFGNPEPSDPCDPTTPTDQCDHYDIWNPEGPNVRWPAATAAAGIHYSLHINTTPEFNTSIEDSFSPWQGASGQKIKFIRDADKNISINSLTISDDINSVRFGDLSNVTEGWYEDPNGRRGYLSIQRDSLTGAATAATAAWHNTITGLIYEADTVLNINLSWSTNPPGFDTYYVPNTMVHEAGHWLDLADLYDPGERELTMYFETAAEELKYASLGKGDAMGVKAIYP